MVFDYVVVGAGFAGCVLAERVASQLDKKVLVIEKRNHIGGNAFDEYNDEGILVHKYGPHIFHTNSKRIFDYLSRFTEWRIYQHRVRAWVDGRLVPIPINLDTVNELYGLRLSSSELEEFFDKVRVKRDPVVTSEDAVVSKVGQELYEKFFRGYTTKQWGVDPTQLDASVTSRIPIRSNRDDRYFSDKYQMMPKCGYTAMFRNMLNHRNIKVLLNTDYREVVDNLEFSQLIYTGPIDAFFDYEFGRLPYRSLNFKFETLEQEWFQSVGTVNYPNDYDFTRITEFKHLTGQKHHRTAIVYEFPVSEGEPYYPVPRDENQQLFRMYEAKAKSLKNVHFVGRLAQYRYYNMDQVVGSALQLFETLAQGR